MFLTSGNVPQPQGALGMSESHSSGMCDVTAGLTGGEAAAKSSPWEWLSVDWPW